MAKKRMAITFFMVALSTLAASVFPYGANNIATGSGIRPSVNSPIELALMGPGANGQPEKTETSKESFTTQRRKYEKKMRAELDRLNGQIAELKAKAAKQSAKTRTEINREIRELNKKSEVARGKLRQLETSSSGAWKDMKKGVDAAMEDLESSYKRAASQFNK